MSRQPETNARHGTRIAFPTMTYPRSAYDETGGLMYFARMCDKIRLKSQDELPEAYHANLGKGSDQRLCTYLGVSYDEVKKRVLHGDTDLQALNWCMEYGKNISEVDIVVWNGFASKRGWKDDASEFLAKSKASSGLADRSDIETMFQYFDVDEGRVA